MAIDNKNKNSPLAGPAIGSAGKQAGGNGGNGDRRSGAAGTTMLVKPGAQAPVAPRRLAISAPKRQEHPDVDEPDIKSKPYYSDEAMIKMINLLYDPMVAALCREAGISDEAQLLSLTKINSSREAWYWAAQIAKEAFVRRYNNNPNEPALPAGYIKWPISKIQRVAFLLARRSLEMTAFKLGVGLANEQNITKSEEGGEETDW